MTSGLLWALALVASPAALAQEDGEESEEVEQADEAEAEEAQAPEEPDKLSNSTFRDWPQAQVPLNRPKGAGLLTNTVVLPEPEEELFEGGPTDELTEVDRILLEEEEAQADARIDAEPSSAVPTLKGHQAAVVLAGAWTGAWLGATYGMHLSDGDSGAAAAGGTTGGFTGLAGGYGLSVGLDPGPRDATLTAAGALAGSWLGYELGKLVLSPDAKDRTERLMAWTSLGDLAGVGAAVGLYGHAPDVQTSVGFVLAGTAGWQLGAGIGDLAGWTDADQPRQRAGVELALGTLFGAGLGAAHHLDLWEPPHPIWAAVGVAEGAWFGAWLPWALANSPTDRQRLGAERISLAAGYLASVGVSRFLDPEPRVLGMQALGFSVGTLVGAGFPLMNPNEAYPRQAVIPMLLGGAAGQVAGTLIEPYYRLNDDDAVLVPMLWAWTGYQMLGWGLMAESQGLGERRTTGVVLTTAGLGTLVTWGVPALIDPSPRQSVLILSSGAWGTWYGAWGSYLLRAQGGRAWAGTLLTGDAALLGMAGATALGFDPSWRQIGLVNAAGAAGAGFGALIGVLASPEARTVSFSSLVGTTVGLAGGTVLARFREPNAGGPSALGPWRPHRPRLAKVPFHVLPMAAPWVSDDGDVGVLVQLAAFEREVDR